MPGVGARVAGNGKGRAGRTGGRVEEGTDVLRFAAVGSVDDGKSTLIGRLLYDTRSVLRNQLEEVEEASLRLGEAEVNLALLTDGLRAEREQNITIDVAYRYFATPKRRFIVADTPGHVQYTRNMVTGASTAELALLLVDASKGLLTQTRRHAFIASLLGIPHLTVAVNKMDLVGYAEEVFERISADFRAFARKLLITDVSFVPVSALRGDNVVQASDRMPWYRGGSLLHQLETVTPRGRRNPIDFRFPVQHVLRGENGGRGYAGTVASGSVRPGQEVLVLPTRPSARIRSVEAWEGPQDEAFPGDAVVLTVDEELDISRGDMIVRTGNVPTVARRLDAYLCWMDREPMDPRRSYRLLHTTRRVEAVVDRLEYRVNVVTLRREKAETLEMNEIGRARLTLTEPIFCDSYRMNSATGSFVLVDPRSHATVAAGMIRGEARMPERPAPKGAGEALGRLPGGPTSPDVVWEGWSVPREERERATGQPGLVVWFTGMSGAGKTTVAREVERRLFRLGVRTMHLDGDLVRHGLCGDLGFSPGDRRENLRRVGEVARLFFEQGSVVLCSFVSPFREDRERLRALFPEGRFLEVLVTASVEELRRRDAKGLYARQEAGELVGLPGVDEGYERPGKPDLVLDTGARTPEEGVAAVVELLAACGVGEGVGE